VSVALFVSPHLDDAVFGCGERVGASDASVVVTVFAGFAPDGASTTAWDRECGFGAVDDVVGLRRAEDAAALAVLGATPWWLDFRDDQYGEPRPTSEIAKCLAHVIERRTPHTIHAPLGLFHADHRRASDAALTLVAGPARWFVYADAIYRRIPGAVDARIAQLAQSGIALAPIPLDERAASPRKREAIACYRSQLQALAQRPALDDVYAPERHWRVMHEDLPR
jgi:LmbE family N-acetylglucosaminyl deacetylase